MNMPQKKTAEAYAISAQLAIPGTSLFQPFFKKVECNKMYVNMAHLPQT